MGGFMKLCTLNRICKAVIVCIALSAVPLAHAMQRPRAVGFLEGVRRSLERQYPLLKSLRIIDWYVKATPTERQQAHRYSCYAAVTAGAVASFVKLYPLCKDFYNRRIYKLMLLRHVLHWKIIYLLMC